MRTLRFACLKWLPAAALFWVLGPGAALADGLGALETFLRQTQLGATTFTQVVTSPPREGEAQPRRKTSSGVFEFQRPDRFRFQYLRPFEQTIVADGQMLWLHDVDLNQVTVRPQQEVLGNTPAALIAAAPDLGGLDRVFVLTDAGERDGLQWVQAVPRAREGQLQWVRIGFRQGQLAALEMLDSFGQRSLLSFGSVDAQPGFKAGHFRFQPPAGADVVRP